MRDIFLQPFDNRLLGCVAATYVIMLIAMATVIYAAKTVLHDEDEKHTGIGEAALWCLSIMCMQGFSFLFHNETITLIYTNYHFSLYCFLKLQRWYYYIKIDFLVFFFQKYDYLSDCEQIYPRIMHLKWKKNYNCWLI